MKTAQQTKESIETSLQAFADAPLFDPALALFNTLGYDSPRRLHLTPNNAENFLANFPHDKPLNEKYALTAEWRSIDFLFQLSDEDVRAAAPQQFLFESKEPYNGAVIESYLFLAIDLKGERYTRTALAGITREINKLFLMPALLLFRHGDTLTLAVINRRLSKRNQAQDVLEKVTVIKDIRFEGPHRAHIEILSDLDFSNLFEKHAVTSFVELHAAWQKTLDISALNKRFYRELAYWYFWSVKQVDFPKGGGADTEKRNAVAVIRMLTRIIFIWFIKENRLVPEDLFDPTKLPRILKSDPLAHPDDSNFYLAILQNLFFATLNVEMGEERRWALAPGGVKKDMLIHSLYRHRPLFQKPDEVLALFGEIPFLNGGLFECLDRELTERDLSREPHLKNIASQEGKGWVLRVDGFSRREEAQPRVPNKIFFGTQPDADLNEDLGTRGRHYEVHGLIDIFNRYKFTVDENTPLEEEVALDPELLGKVFENLLASYNEDTKSTARKLSGSFYTPREVVDYMVEEALITYLDQKVPGLPDAQQRLRALVSQASEPVDFSQEEAAELVDAIERMHVLDPACGSGAFLMGMLTKLVQVLKKLDPENSLWKAKNRASLEVQLRAAKHIPDPLLREERVAGAEAELEKFDRDFADSRHADYPRKLYLIEKCIYGVDIQPIAVQIAKLRFFISLVVSQAPDRALPNAGITALPNLETKIVSADSLIQILGTQKEIQYEAITELERELTLANQHHFAARTTRDKRRARENITALRDKLGAMLQQDLALPAAAVSKLVQWNPFDQNAAASFFEPEWMFQLTEGFDICIGNPPYVRQEQIKHLKPFLKDYQCYSGTSDLYVYFYERAIKLLKPGGVFAFITSNKWYRAKYGEKLRAWMNQNTRLQRIIDFGDAEVFDAIAYPTIVIATRRSAEVMTVPATDTFSAMNWNRPDKEAVKQFPAIFAEEKFDVAQAELGKNGWQLEPPVKRRLLERIRAAGVPLGEYVEGHFYYGIKTGLNEAFVIDGPTRASLIAEDHKSAEIIKPFLRGRDVKRWRVEAPDLWLIFTRKGTDIKRYSAIHKHLKAFKAQLMPKPSDWDDRRNGAWPGRKAGSYEWYEIQDNIAYWRYFEEPKIVYPDIALSPQFAWDEAGRYLANTAYIIPCDDKALLASLNSPVCAWFYSQISSQIQNGYYRFIAQYVETIPVPRTTIPQTSTLIQCIEAVLGEGEVKYEKLLNGLVYELYFPEELHAAGLHLFDLAEQARLPDINTLPEASRLETLRAKFEELNAPGHPLRAALDKLATLETVRIIEGRA